jgi:mRNA interferase YafQ
MRQTKYTVKFTTQFKRDYKLEIKRGLNIELLEEVVTVLSMGKTLPEKYKDHALSGNWVGHRECHIQPDRLLIYHIEDNVLVLTLSRTGTHSDLFRK